MATFQDKNSKKWTIELTIGTVLRVKKESEDKFNLFEPDSKVGSRELREVVLQNPLEFWELLAYIVEPQFEDGYNAENFGQDMAADCLIDAQRVFLQEWRDFFRGLRQPEMAVALEKMIEWQDALVKKAEAELRKEVEQMDEKVMAKIDSELSTQSGVLRDSVDSILGLTPGDS